MSRIWYLARVVMVAGVIFGTLASSAGVLEVIGDGDPRNHHVLPEEAVAQEPH